MTGVFNFAPGGSVLPGSPVPGSLSDDLRLAASRGQVQTVKELLVAGADLEADKDGRNALHYAAQEGHAEVCKYLAAHGCDVNMQDLMGSTPLLRAASQGAKDALQILLDAGCDIDMQDEHGNAALHETCWNGFSQAAELLVKYNCNVCLINKAGFTALHLAAQNGHNECSRVLLYAGCNPDMKNNYGDTALHTASRYGHAGVARILISAKCKLSEQNKNGDTALHISAALKRRKIAKILVESGIDTELLNKQNERAVDVARRKEHPEIILIITSYSRSHPSSSHRPRGDNICVTFKDAVEFEDKLEACPVDESPLKHEPKADMQEKERRFFFFKKKKKGKEKTPVVPAVTSHKKAEGEHINSGHGKPAVHGFFSQYVPRDGVQLYRDLAGNIKQGPIGYAPVCQCGPSLKRLEHSITDTRESLYNHIDTSHHILSQRIDHLDIQTKQQAYTTKAMVHDRLNNERNACHARISECLQEERLETKAMFDQSNAGMKDELEYWLNDKLASYGHCLDHHHDDSALPPRNLFFDFPTMGRLVRSRSDETLSASDYSGKFRKRDFYASRQAAMQQIRGWDVPNTENISNQDRPRNKERNNNVIPNSNKVITHAQVHFREPEKTRNFSPNTILRTSPGTLTTPLNAGILHNSGQSVHKSENASSISRNNNMSLKQTTQDTSQRNYYKKTVPQPRVTFSSDKQIQHVRQPYQHHSGLSSPPPASSPQNVVAPIIRRQSLRNSTRMASPGPQNNIRQPMEPASQQSWWSQQNLLEGGPPSTDMKFSELGGSRIPSLTEQERNSIRNARQQNVKQIFPQCQDRYSFHYDRPRTLSADSLLNEESHLTYSKDMVRCHSVENTLDDNEFKKADSYNSGYVTDSALRSSSTKSNSKITDNSRSVKSTHSASPASRTTYRYRLPETSTNPDVIQPGSHIISALNSSQENKHFSSRQVSSHAQSSTNMNMFLNTTLDLNRKIAAHRPQDIPRESNYSKALHKSMYGLSEIRADKSGPVFSNIGKSDLVIYPEKSDSVSRSDINLTTSKAHSVHFTSAVKECLQHEGLVSTNSVPSPAFTTGNKEDSTCSSNQDSGYSSRNHAAGLRRGADTSGGTPSSSFSMERSSCNTPSNADSPYATHGELSNTGIKTYMNDHSSSPAMCDSKYQFSSNTLLSENVQSLSDSSSNSPLHRGSISEKPGSDFRYPYIVNSNDTVPLRNESLDKYIYKSFDPLHQGSSYYNTSSQIQSPQPFNKPSLQQKSIPVASINSRPFTNASYDNATYFPPEKQLQSEEIQNQDGKNERQKPLYHVESLKPSFQNSINNQTACGINHNISSSQALREQTYKPTLLHYNVTSLLNQIPQSTVSSHSYRLNTSQNRVSYSQQQNQGMSPAAVQDHIQGWYQRKLMEAAQRLRESQNYSQQNFDQHDTKNDYGYQPKQDSFSRTNEFGVYSHNGELVQSQGINYQSQYYGSRSQSKQVQLSPQSSKYENYQQPSNMQEKKECENVTLPHKDGNFKSSSAYERGFVSNNNASHPQQLGLIYHVKPQNNNLYSSSKQATAHNIALYDFVKGSDV